jgi:dipeptidase E
MSRMKLYLSSYRIPTPDDLAKLLGKPLHDTSVALIPNAKDYYSERAWRYKVGDLVTYMEKLGLSVDIVDLRDFNDTKTLQAKLAAYDLVWAMGGNTYVLRYEMHRSGFDLAIHNLLKQSKVYGGDSAGALVAGPSIAGVESADQPEFAEELITEGLGLIPFVILPHADNPEFASVTPLFRKLHIGKREIVELKDSQAVIITSDDRKVVEAN